MVTKIHNSLCELSLHTFVSYILEAASKKHVCVVIIAHILSQVLLLFLSCGCCCLSLLLFTGWFFVVCLLVDRKVPMMLLVLLLTEGPHIELFIVVCLQEGAMMRDVILAIRADEAHHRVVNHTLSSMDQHLHNPSPPGH